MSNHRGSDRSGHGVIRGHNLRSFSQSPGDRVEETEPSISQSTRARNSPTRTRYHRTPVTSNERRQPPSPAGSSTHGESRFSPPRRFLTDSPPWFNALQGGEPAGDESFAENSLRSRGDDDEGSSREHHQGSPHATSDNFRRLFALRQTVFDMMRGVTHRRQASTQTTEEWRVEQLREVYEELDLIVNNSPENPSYSGVIYFTNRRMSPVQDAEANGSMPYAWDTFSNEPCCVCMEENAEPLECGDFYCPVCLGGKSPTSLPSKFLLTRSRDVQEGYRTSIACHML